MIERENLINIGSTFKTHGFKGELKCALDITVDDIPSSMPLFFEIEGIFVPFYTEYLRGRGDNNIIKIEWIDTDEQALLLVNKDFYLLRPDYESWKEEKGFEDIEEDSDIIGFRVFDNDTHEELGTVEEIMENPEYDYMSVKNPKNGEEFMLPIIDEFIIRIDEEVPGKGSIWVSLPEGLLDLNKKN